MKWKEIATRVVLFSLLIISFISTHAEENTTITVDNATINVSIDENKIMEQIREREMLALKNQLGREVQKLVLLKEAYKLEIQLETLEEYINDEAVLENISVYKAELEELKQEINELDPKSEDFIEKYVIFKEELRNLFFKIRDDVKNCDLNEELKLRIRERIRERLNNNETLNQLRTRVREKIQQYNQEQLRNMFRKLGCDDCRLETNNYTNVSQLRQRIREMLAKRFRNRVKIQQLRTRIQEFKMKREILKKELRKKIETNLKEEYKKHLMKKYQWMKTHKPKIFERMKNLPNRRTHPGGPMHREMAIHNSGKENTQRQSETMYERETRRR